MFQKSFVIGLCMFGRTVLSILFLLISLSALASEVATIIGTPDPSLEFVKEMQIDKVGFFIPSLEQRVTTYIYSLLSSCGIQSSTAFEVMGSDGTGTTEDVSSALHKAAATSTVVLVPVGGSNMNDLCEIMTSHADTIYVLAQKGMRLQENPKCGSKNILLVAALNEDHTDLADYSGFGLGYRIAAPSSAPGIGPGGKPLTLWGVTPSATLTVGHIARFRRSHPELSGVELIQRFLDESTDRLPSLNGKVEGEHILRNTIKE